MGEIEGLKPAGDSGGGVSRRQARKASGARQYLPSRIPIGRESNTMDKTIRWCCVGFEGHVQAAGSRGTAIFVDRSDGPSKFVLQFRGVDRGRESDLGPVRVPVSLVQDAVIQFCPWCGVRLRDWYADALDALHRPDLRIAMK